MFRSSLLDLLVPSRRTLSPPQTRRRIFFEPLEERRVLAAVSDGGTATLSIALAADEDLTIVSQGSSYLFGSDLTFIAGSVADSADFSGFGGSSLTLNTSGLTRYSTISITDAAANATVTFNDSGANAYSDHFTITLNNVGSGTIAFNGTSDFNSSTVTLSSPGAIVAGTANIAAATLDIRAGTFTLGMNDQIGNGTNLIVSGGTFALGTFNETVGGVTLTSGSITGTTGILTSATTFDMRKGTVSANLAGAVGLNKSTADIVTLTGTNTYSEATTITGGMIEADDSNALGNASATNDLVFNGAGTHLRALGTITSPTSRDVVFITPATFDSNNHVISLAGIITGGAAGTQAFVKNGVGTLVLGNSSNTFSGQISVNAGILSVGSNGALGNAFNDITLQSGGATLQVTGNTILGPECQVVVGASATHTFDVAAGATLTVSRGLNGFNNTIVRKTGSGTLVLNAAATNLGSTIIDAGTLLANNPAGSALGPAGTTITVNNTGVLGGTGAVAGAVIVNSGGAIAPGTSAGKLKTGSVSLPSGTNFNIELNGATAGTGHDQLDVTGSVTLNDANLNLTLGYVPVNGQTFTILNNDGVDGILGSGTFKVGGVTIPDGGSFVIGANTFFIDYTAGLDNNDVVLTVQTNIPPTAEAGGPYSVSEGSSIQLSATSSTDPDQAANTLTYEWDYDYDGVTFQVDALGSTPTFSAASLDDPLTRTLAVRVTDNAGASNIDTATLTVNNVAPSLMGVAITSPILENGTAHLTGTISDPGTLDTFTLVVNWGEGAPVNYNFPAGTTAFDVAHQYKDDNPTATASDVYNVSYSLTDDNAGAATPAATTVTVSNVAPVAALAGPTVGVRSQSLAFTGSFTDVGSLDSHEVQWNFGDGVEIPFQPSTNLNALTPAHSYATSGTYTVSFTVKDDDGGQHTVSTSIAVVAVMLETAPCGCGTAVVVGGTEAADTIAVNKDAAGGVEIVVNGVSLGAWDPSQAIVAYGYGGWDEIQVQPTITNLGVWLYGGQGDDRLKGGGGHDVVMGGEGDDLIVGSWGRDILIGGTGVDRIVGNGDDDILISGTTDYDGNAAALFAILAEWASDRDANSRVNNISNIGSGPRLNENYFLTAATVHDDGVRDLLTGSTGFDWFFANLSLTGDDDSLIKDKITDLSAAEFVQDIDFIGS